MAYYTSTTKADLEAYNTLVKTGEGYNGTTTNWATIVEHPNGLDFAILKHPNYDATLTIEESLGAEWYPNPEL
jgi:hypothetical protein